MDQAKPGHTVEFQGLKGAAHLNGTKGTLVEFLKKEQRWSVRCELDNTKVCAKPDNLILHRSMGGPIIGGNYTPQQASRRFGGASPGMSADPPSPSAWATGLSEQDRYEWFSNCYQMRCDDDYQWGGCNLHGPYDPDATPQSIAKDFLVFCLLAHRHKAVPPGWNWPAFLKKAANLVQFAFEKSDAKERWGSENYFEAQMGGRSLRFTGETIYKSAVNTDSNSSEHMAAEQEVRSNQRKIQDLVGGTQARSMFVEDLGRGSRFARAS